MTSASRSRQITGWQFIIQMASLGFFSRIVLILSILSLLSLNDYFTTPSQISSLLPAGAFIILLLSLVTFADNLSSQTIQKIINRLERIQTVFGFEIIDLENHRNTASHQRHYLRTVFFPFVTSVLPAPLILAALISAAPQLFVITIIQAIVNCYIVYFFNRIHSANYGDKVDQAKSNSLDLMDSNSNIHILRRGHGPSRSQVISLESSGEVAILAHHRKRDALRTSNLLFRALILITSAVLAIYKISSLASLVGYFLLNNTVRHSFVILAEYLWPSYRNLTFSQSCSLIDLGLTPEMQLFGRLQALQEKQNLSYERFDQLMLDRLNQRPYLRFKDFNVSRINDSHSILIDSLTARIEIASITLIYIASSKLCREVTEIVLDQGRNSLKLGVRGIAVCAQQVVDSTVWTHFPISDPNRCQILSTSVVDHYPQEHKKRVSALMDKYQLNRLYMEGDSEPLSVSSLTSKQIKRMKALMSILDLILQPHCLWLAPFAVDPFEESEALSLLDFYKKLTPHNQRVIFLLSRQLPIVEGYRYYELTRTSLKSTC